MIYTYTLPLTSLVARVQKIIHADPERLNVSKNAAFAIALATEMFIQHLANSTHNVIKAERKPRRNIQYRDVSNAIAKTDNLEFAVDVVPKTTTFKEARKKNAEREEREKGAEKAKENGKGKGKEREKEKEIVNGGAGRSGVVEEEDDVNGVLAHVPVQEASTINGHAAISSATTSPAQKKAATIPDAMDVDERVVESDPEDDAAAMQLEMEMRGPPQPEARRSTGGFTSINGAN
ncbi:hypothetical protein GQ44DRAFT_732419 [Phaeosphaeriaceae sp. PMI808]|nr:hypothetical protein GQ44DRAFT_732419 [Phaeosphaeriaceae sp. PMI808]